MKQAIVFCLIFSQSLFVTGCPRSESTEAGQLPSKTTVATSGNRRTWHAATYRGLTMGKSTLSEMRRVLGAPKRSETFNDGRSYSEVWYYYDSIPEYPGTLRVVVDKTKNLVRAIDIQPKDLSKEEANRLRSARDGSGDDKRGVGLKCEASKPSDRNW